MTKNSDYMDNDNFLLLLAYILKSHSIQLRNSGDYSAWAQTKWNLKTLALGELTL